MRLVPGSAMHFPRDCESHRILVLQFPLLSVGDSNLFRGMVTSLQLIKHSYLTSKICGNSGTII